ncbi:winged helix-turn-helix transcriptional regulator [Pectinatus cerevisiiphilus]|uniref:HxlR family transcriptional regulator n=1 Tax=Pectinatus cerevisiiphilus TaxID=86956 RepID=A0A4R3K4U0_9FIRM|nr:helix-turn-helix domain-containing protein [Pectinatus cerevisiiphilus]TCS77779.1 HxlR family transcriptional regulator [Pectinatus cerevisiiphilus]
MIKFSLCPRYEIAFELLGKKWTGLIIRCLLDGPKRFSDLTDIIPHISAKVLADRMKELEQHGIIVRNVYPEIPVKIEYSLTDRGKDLQRALDEVQHWAEKWIIIDQKKDV